MVLLAGLVASGCQSQRPNIVLILADDMGYETVGAYGGRSYATPRIDRLAADGMRFEQAYAQPLCTPSRVKLLTGRSNARNYQYWAMLPQGETTFAHVLHDQGYHTLIAGKWQLDRYGGQLPEQAGFDEHIAFELRGPEGERYWDPDFVVNGAHQLFPGAFGPDVITDYIDDFIDRYRDEPFLVFYPMLLPHRPFVATPDAPDATTVEDRFAAMVAYADKMVGKVVDHLALRDLTRNTIVIFVSDNGTEAQFVSDVNGELVRGGKGFTSDAGTRVPFIASWPGRIEAGSVASNPVDLSVFFPTMAELAEVPVPDDLDGWSIRDQLLGAGPGPRDWIYMYFRPDPAQPYRAEFARRGPYKLYRGDGLVVNTIGQTMAYQDRSLFDERADTLESDPIAPGEGDPEDDEARGALEAILAQWPSTPWVGPTPARGPPRLGPLSTSAAPGRSPSPSP